MIDHIRAEMRSFVALNLPEDLRARLAALQEALPLKRRVPAENLHLTLAFLDEQPPELLEELHLALAGLHIPAFEVVLDGAGSFGSGRMRSLHIKAHLDTALAHLQRKVVMAVRNAGIGLPSKRFVPHVTLVRLAGGRPDAIRLERAISAVEEVGPLRFFTSEFVLYRSHLTRHGAEYEPLAVYPLVGGVPQIPDR